MRIITKSMLTLLLLCAGVVNVLADDFLETPLTADMFKQWDGDGATAKSTAAATVDFNIGNDATIKAGGMVCGTSSVAYLTYADVTGIKKLVIEGTPGMQLRVLMNRKDSDNGPLVERNPTINSEGKAELDVSDLEFVHINAIKAGWSSPEGKITSIKGLVEVDIEPIAKEMFKVWDGDGATAKSTGDATVDFNIGNDATIKAGGMVCGTSSVAYLTYADLSGAMKLLIEGTPGMQLRVLMNRQGSDNGPLVERNPTIDAEGKAELDLSDLDFVHVNAIKAGWSSPEGKITAIKTVKKAAPKITMAKDLFKVWDGDGASATSTGAATVDFNIGNDATIKAGGMVCGTSSVAYLTYADLTGAKKMLIEGTPGMQLRVLMNRQGSDNGPLVEKNPVIGTDGKAELDLSELAFVHINAIKAGWSSPEGKISSIVFVMPAKDADPLAPQKKELQEAIDAASILNGAAYDYTFDALAPAIAAAEYALADPTATEASLKAAKDALDAAVKALQLKGGYYDLTKADFNDGGCAYVVGKESDMPYGLAGVDWKKYADLTDYDKLVVTLANGTPRFYFNRKTQNGQDNEDEAKSELIDMPTMSWGNLRYLTVSPDQKVYTVDLQKMSVEQGRAVLHAIKGLDNAKITISGLYKVNTSNIDVQQQSIGRLKGNDLYPDAGALSMPLTNEDNMILNPTKESKEDIRLWENENGTVELQIKKGSTFFIQTASEGKTVYKIKFVGDNIKLVCSNGTFEVPEKPNYKTVVWDGDIDAVKFWAVEDMKLTLVRVYSRPSDTNTDLYEKNDDEVAKAVVDALKRTLKEANATDLKDMTDESVEAFNEALAGARMQEEMKTSIVDIEAARLALKDAIAGLKEKPASGEIIVDLDGSLYHNWSEVSGTAEDKGAVPGGGVILDEEVAIGGSIWGNLSGAVPYLDYANITDFTEMRIEGTPGATIRIMCNRTTDEGPIYEIKPTFDADGKITVKISDLKFLNGGTPCDFVCLQSIKVPASWAGGTMAATIKSIKLVKIVPVDIVEDFDASFYHNWSEVSGTAEDKGVVAGGGVKLGEEVAIGGSIWGNLSGAVPYLDYANITDYDELRFEGTPGATIRIMCNRTTDEGPIYEIKPTFDADGKITVKISDLKFLNGGTPCDFVCLQSIKVPASWAGGTMPATITSIKIVKKSGVEPEPTPEPAKNDLTKEIFKKWSGIDAEATSESTGCDLVLNTEVGPGSIVYGNASVSYLTYANLKGYKELVINGTPGMQLRVLFNRQEVDGDDPNGGALTELNPTIGEDGKAVIDLLDAALNGAARLNAIKTGWGSPAGTITGFELVEGGSVGVVNVKANNKPQRIYNLGGQLLNKPVKGINIIDGKKVYIP